MSACKSGNKEFTIFKLVGAEVEGFESEVRIAGIKLHYAKEEEKPELHGAHRNVDADFGGLWALHGLIGFTWGGLPVLLIRPDGRLLQLLWGAEVILMAVLLLWVWLV